MHLPTALSALNVLPAVTPGVQLPPLHRGPPWPQHPWAGTRESGANGNHPSLGARMLLGLHAVTRELSAAAKGARGQ